MSRIEHDDAGAAAPNDADSRATDPEQELAVLQQTLETARSQIAEQAKWIGALERRGAIDAALVEAGAVDLESARHLVEAALSGADEPDIAAAVSDLKRRKAFLFAPSLPRSGVMGAHSTAAPALEERLDRAAADAGASGRRQDLLRYLRLRRTKR